MHARCVAIQGAPAGRGGAPQGLDRLRAHLGADPTITFGHVCGDCLSSDALKNALGELVSRRVLKTHPKTRHLSLEYVDTVDVYLCVWWYTVYGCCMHAVACCVHVMYHLFVQGLVCHNYTYSQASCMSCVSCLDVYFRCWCRSTELLVEINNRTRRAAAAISSAMCSSGVLASRL